MSYSWSDRDIEKLKEGRKSSLDMLDQLLSTWESQFQKRGGSVFWAADTKALKEHLDSAPQGKKRHLGVSNDLGWLTPELAGFGKGAGPMESGKSEPWHLLPVECLISASGLVLIKKSRLAHNTKGLVLVAGLERILSNTRELAGYMKAAGGSAEEYLLLGDGHLEGQQLEVIILDNGRTQLLGEPVYREALQCLGCEACSQIHGQHSVGAARAILDSYLQLVPSYDQRFEPFQMPTYPAVDERCPVGVSQSQLSLQARHKQAQDRKSESELRWKAWRKASASRKLMDVKMLGASPLRLLLKSTGIGEKNIPKASGESFNQSWVKRRPKNSEGQRLTDLPKGKLWIKDNSGHNP